MHPCLRIPELLAIAYQELDSESDKQSLAVLARTCKAFSAPALRLLWKEQNSLIPLLKCLPDDVVECTSTSSDPDKEAPNETMRFRRALRPEDWTRPIFYSYLIQNMSLLRPEDVLANIDEQGLQELHRTLTHFSLGSPLLRNLKAFRYHAHSATATAYPFLATAIGSQLQSLSYQNNGAAPSPSELSLILGIARSSPSLEEFSCSGLADCLPPPRACLDLVLDSLHHLQALETVSIPCYYPLLGHLTELPSLNSLFIEGRTCSFFPPEIGDFSRRRVVHRFKALKRLALDFDSAELAISFFDHVDFRDCPLEFFSFHLQQIGGPENQLRLNSLLAAKTPITDSLGSVSVSIQLASEEPGLTFGEVLDAMIKTRQIRSLEVVFPELLVQGPTCLQAGDSLVQHVARRWNMLRELTIIPCAVQGIEGIEQVSLASLAHLADHCPNLGYLRVALNALNGVPMLQGLPEDDGDGSGQLPSKRLTKHRQEIDLEFWDPSPIKMVDAESIAIFFRKVFFRVESLEVWGTSRWKDAWDAVDELVQDAQFEDEESA